MRGAAAEPRISPILLRAFAPYAERYLGRHLHALRLSKAAPAPRPAAERPLVVYLNHPAWWDPLVGMALALRLYPERSHRAPIEAAALARYRFFGRLGFFGVEPGTARGARRFLAVAESALARPNAALWLTPGGRFADPRERPPALAAGLGHLARRLRRGVLVPLALEYPFWEERSPEALARFGEPLDAEAIDLPAAGWTALLAERLAAAQDALAREALARDPARFETLLRGSAGVGGAYDLWRRLRARARGERFRPEHGAAPAPFAGRGRA
jgi:1-acyl-sn-glycerol-3-phosphate acyltransferase